MAIEKYRVRDVARDFGMPAKVITEILDKYATAPKSNMQALEDHELSIVFEHLTQNNQISNIAPFMLTSLRSRKPPRRKRLRPRFPRLSLLRHSRPQSRHSSPSSVLPSRDSRSPHRPSLSRSRSSRSSGPRSSRQSSSRSLTSPQPPLSPPPVCLRKSWWIPARAAT